MNQLVKYGCWMLVALAVLSIFVGVYSIFIGSPLPIQAEGWGRGADTMLLLAIALRLLTAKKSDAARSQPIL